MSETIRLIEISKLRNSKEKLYLTLIIIVAILFWAWTLISIIQPFFTTLTADTFANSCFQKTASGVQKKSGTFDLGKNCLSWSSLTLQEKQSIIDTQDDLGNKILNSLITPLAFVVFFLLSLFLHLLSIGYIRLNAVKIGPEQFPKLWEEVNTLSRRIGLANAPDIFINNGEGVMNAFATKLIYRKIIVVHSNLAEVLINGNDQKQLSAVLGHELGHHALGHTSWLNYLIGPAFIIPFLGKAYSRARESSSDQVMKILVPDTEACSRALIKLAAGGKIGQEANITAYKAQIEQERGFFAWFSEVLSTHPFLPKRIRAIE